MDALLSRAAAALRLNLDLGEREEKILLFSLQVLWTNALSLVSIILLALATGLFQETVWAMLAGSSLRVVSGGAHAETPGRCATIGAVVYVTLGFLAGFAADRVWPGWSFGFATAAWLAVILAVIIFAPADTPAKPITGPRRRKLKRWSLLVLAAWALFMVWSARQPFDRSGVPLLAVTLGLAWQASTLTPAGYRLGRILDDGLKRLLRGSV